MKIIKILTKIIYIISILKSYYVRKTKNFIKIIFIIRFISKIINIIKKLCL